ncbi:MAG: methyltransferase [Saprospiraceae bacterium]
MSEELSYFQFKHFRLAQSEAVMKVSTDSRLLGGYASRKKFNNVLDVGTGMGIVSFILAHSNPIAQILGIDRSSEAISLAELSKSLNAGFDNVQFLNVDLNNFMPSSKFDLIVSNPPYFVNQQSAQTDSRKLIRHTESNFIEFFCRKALDWTLPNTYVIIIIPVQMESDWTYQMSKNGFVLGEFIRFRHNVNAEYSLCICIYTRNFAQLITLDYLIKNSDDSYSDDFIKIVGEF